MDGDGGPAFSNAGTDFQHMSPQHLHPGWIEVVGIIFHERRPSPKTGRHDFQRSNQCRRFPVTFGAEAVAVGHESLDRQAG